MDVVKYYSELIRSYQTSGKASSSMQYAINDPIARPFKLLVDQQVRLKEAKRETLSHAWVREAHGKLELAPLDDGFRQLQAEISDLERKISQNEAVIADLGRVYARHEIEEPSMMRLEGSMRKIADQIEEIQYKQQAEAMPIYTACGVAMADPKSHPKIEELEAKAAEQIKPLEESRVALDKQIAAINSALAGCAM